MNRRKNNFLRLIMVFLVIGSCTREPSPQKLKKNEDFLTIDFYDSTNVEKLDISNWECYSVSTENICFPKDWIEVRQSKYLFLSFLEERDKNIYLVGIKFEREELGINDYLSEVADQAKMDTVDILQNHSIKELVFEDEDKSYFAEFHTKDNEGEYYSYCMYKTFGNYLFDITLKVPYDQKEAYQKIFQGILSSFQSNEKYVFSQKNNVKKFRSLNIDSL